MHTEVDKNKIKNGLYIVSTPIGNLGDITLRAIEILKISDYILCEDTRVSKKLLNKLNIKNQLISNYKFNEKKNVNKVLEILSKKKIVSLISDAGTPTISDPGKILIKECIKKNIDIYPIPGPSAVTAAISISGFSDKYYFHGFLSSKLNSSEKELKLLSEQDCSIIFFISSKKINKIIGLLKKYFIDRDIVICKEITKYYEGYYRYKISNIEKFDINLKGEITVVISEKNNLQKNINKLNESDKRKISKLINKISIKDIIHLINEEKNISKREIYNYCLKIKNEN
tara:strand:- start:298 stop:1155 length:858 start_codon:yes stop_codon:yes gene_type:complete